MDLLNQRKAYFLKALNKIEYHSHKRIKVDGNYVVNKKNFDMLKNFYILSRPGT